MFRPIIFFQFDIVIIKTLSVKGRDASPGILPVYTPLIII
jgi:hypothetical protein